MAEYSYFDNPESRKHVIDHLFKDSRKLSDWEKKFIKSIKDYTEQGGFLSENQKQKLSDLWEKY